ncbi:MAG: hypothetical protein DHS20C17_27700 [Cyclobacteriaceae bacterium]|nr:MAG: hypothetical protein DHS20C17_27700 [Cyclobacteriaceae bacterium]
MESRELERLVETLLVSDLEKAEQKLIEAKDVDMVLPGTTPGEKLSYIAAAKWIGNKIRQEKCEFRAAYEAYLEVIKEK